MNAKKSLPATLPANMHEHENWWQGSGSDKIVQWNNSSMGQWFLFVMIA